MEDNNNDKNTRLNLAEKNYSISNKENATGFKINTETSENINSDILAVANSIKLAGTFTPKLVGKRRLITSLQFNEGQEVQLACETEVIQVQLDIELEKPVELPAKFPLKSDQEIIFLITNPSELDATNITITDISNLLEISIIREKLVGEYYEKGGEAITIENFNNAKNHLNPSERFRVTGKLKTDKTGTKKLEFLVKYAELETLKEDDADKQGIKFEKEFAIVGINIVGRIKPQLPAKIKLGKNYEVTFIFTNQSNEFPATGLQIDVKQESINKM